VKKVSSPDKTEIRPLYNILFRLAVGFAADTRDDNTIASDLDQAARLHMIKGGVGLGEYHPPICNLVTPGEVVDQTLEDAALVN
jgi:hypothetical protein